MHVIQAALTFLNLSEWVAAFCCCWDLCTHFAQTKCLVLHRYCWRWQMSVAFSDLAIFSTSRVLSSLSLFMWSCKCLRVHTSLRPRIQINKWTFPRVLWGWQQVYLAPAKISTGKFITTRMEVQWEWTFLRVICFRNLRTPAEMSTIDKSQQCIDTV